MSISNYSQKRYLSLKQRYQSEISDAQATIEGYLSTPVHIGEHPQHSEEIDAALEKAASAEDKLEQLLKVGAELGIEATPGGSHEMNPGFSRPIHS